MALPASQVICKVCRLPCEATGLDAEARLLAQVEQLFPFPLDDLALDFQVLGVSAECPAHTDVLVAACRQSQLDPLEHMFDQAGLQVAAMEVDSFALLRASGAKHRVTWHYCSWRLVKSCCIVGNEILSLCVSTCPWLHQGNGSRASSVSGRCTARGSMWGKW